MELNTSLIFLLLLVLPPMLLAGQEVVNILLSDKQMTNTALSQRSEHEKFPGRSELGAVYDGMITVEIPIAEVQVIAYEPLLPVDEDFGIEILPPANTHSRV